MNWVLGAHPIKAVSGLGGRQVRTGTEHGHIFDHFAVEFEYPGGVSMFSQSRQINGCLNIVGEEIVGTGGKSNCRDRIEPIEGKKWRHRDKEGSPYRLEHEHLIASIGSGNPINEAQAIAESTMTGIMGREAVYSGQELTWDAAINATRRLGPEKYEFGDYATPAGSHAWEISNRLADFCWSQGAFQAMVARSPATGLNKGGKSH